MTEVKDDIEVIERSVRQSPRLRIPMIAGRKHTVEEFGCRFTVYRQTAPRHVVSVSLWKASMGYVPALSNALLWWGRNIKKLFPGFNLRVYLDKSVAKEGQKQRREGDIDWEPILAQLHKNRNVELWLHDCGWGKLGAGEGRGYSQTFSSIVRFHALFDPTVDVAVIRNLELLSSKYDAKLIRTWMRQGGGRYHTYVLPYLYGCYPRYIPSEGYIAQCRRAGLEGKRMLLAGWFAAKGTLSSDDFQYLLSIVQKLGYNYGYGVDEVILTELFLNPVDANRQWIMTRMNTNITYMFDLGIVFKLAQDLQDDVFMHWVEGKTHEWERQCTDPVLPIALRQALELHEVESMVWASKQAGGKWGHCMRIEKDILEYFRAQKVKFIREDPVTYATIFKKLNTLIKAGYFSNEVIPNLFDARNFIRRYLRDLSQEEEVMALTAIMQISVLQQITFPGFAFKTKDFSALYRQPTKRKYLIETLRENVLQT